jgi:hypothetical protein
VNSLPRVSEDPTRVLCHALCRAPSPPPRAGRGAGIGEESCGPPLRASRRRSNCCSCCWCTDAPARGLSAGSLTAELECRGGGARALPPAAAALGEAVPAMKFAVVPPQLKLCRWLTWRDCHSAWRDSTTCCRCKSAISSVGVMPLVPLNRRVICTRCQKRYMLAVLEFGIHCIQLVASACNTTALTSGPERGLVVGDPWAPRSCAALSPQALL